MSGEYYRVWQFSKDQAIVKRGKLTIDLLALKGEKWVNSDGKEFAAFPEVEKHYTDRKVMPS